MRWNNVSPGFLRFGMLWFGLLAAAAPASAQWSKVDAIPTKNVLALFTNADTIAVGVDSVTFVSTNGGATWQRSSRLTPVVFAVPAVWFRNGRLYGSALGQGVFVSDNLGLTWQAYNQGLVGGLFDTQLEVVDLQQRGDSLYAATSGAGVYVRGFGPLDTWHHFGEEFEPNQASNVDDLALGGTRLLAIAGDNGMVFRRDPGEPDWTTSLLDNIGPEAGLQARSAVWTGTQWLVGSNIGVFRSALGQEPWTFFDPGLGALANNALATDRHRVYGAFTNAHGTIMAFTDDDGATWLLLEGLPNVFVFKLGVLGSKLFAARADGLWVRSIGTVSAPPGGPLTSGLAFALSGANPVTGAARLRFELPEAGPASIEVFDVRGRRVGEVVRASFAAGPNEIAWNAQSLSPGVYAARLTAGARHAVVRFVHVR